MADKAEQLSRVNFPALTKPRQAAVTPLEILLCCFVPLGTPKNLRKFIRGLSPIPLPVMVITEVFERIYPYYPAEYSPQRSANWLT